LKDKGNTILKLQRLERPSPAHGDVKKGHGGISPQAEPQKEFGLFVIDSGTQQPKS
jgi:hypothetical protein